MSQSPIVAATTANPAAGTVVTEMKTPTNAADFADTNESIPAAPASSATTNENGPTWKMKSTPCSSRVLVSSTQPKASNPNVAPAVTAMATGKPMSSAAEARRASDMRRRTSATANAASGPNSGPTTNGDRRVGEHADGGEQARDAQEQQERDVQLGFVAGTRDQLVPDHRVCGVAVGGIFGVVGRTGQHGVEHFQRDRAEILHIERLEPLHDVIGGFPGDVGRDLVTGRLDGRIGMQHDVSDAGLSL